MKKSITVTLAVIILLSCMGLTAYTKTETLSAKVYVTIADKTGKLVLTQEEITVTDTDKDGSLTVNDALYAAHEAKYESGASAGYAYADTAYGLSLIKLWGTENGGSYGYCVNNKSALSLADTVTDGDYISAYVFTDLTAWSDTYCYFNVNTAAATAGKEITLTLSANGYDAAYNPIVVPVEAAVITLNGEKTAFKTDKNGKVTITVSAAGDYIISAISDTQTLVPPVCKVSVSAAPVTEFEIPITPESEVKPEAEKSPKTDDSSAYELVSTIMLLSLAVTAILIVGKRKFYE